MNKKTSLLIGAVIICLSFSVIAKEKFDKNYYTIKSIQIEEIPDTNQELFIEVPVENIPAKPVPADEINFGEIINIGKEIWKIIEGNKPVTDIRSDSATATPPGIINWTQMEYWQPLKSTTYKVTYKNLYDVAVVDFSFRLSYFYGGKAAGKGNYLANVTVLPANLSVAWGYKFTLTAKIPAVVNLGSIDNPLAGMQLDLNWQIDTYIKHIENTISFLVYGDGRIDKHD